MFLAYPICYSYLDFQAKMNGNMFQKVLIFFAHENIGKLLLKVAYFTTQSQIFTLPTAQNQPKYHILFHKNGSPWDLYIMTLFALN